MQNLRARYYSPEQGRFISKDPFPGILSQPASLTPYVYALNNPVRYTDPSGEFIDTLFDIASVGYDIYTIADKYNRGCSVAWTDWASLGMDALSLALPFVPAAGMVVRFAAHTDDVGDVIRLTNKTDDIYQGVRSASKYLKEAGIPRSIRKQILESFDVRTIQVRISGLSEYGIRYYDNVNAFEKGRYLFDTFPASRESLAIKFDWNQMTDFRQWQIRPGTTLIQGRAVSQGVNFPGGQLQKFVLNLEDLLP